MLSIAVPAGLLVGLLLGALGGGGSILTVPILVYLLHQEPHAATAGSLLIVGITAAAGMVAHRQAGRVRLAPGIAFGVLGVAGAYAGTRLSSSVPPDLLLSLFAALMLAAAAAMLRRRPGTAGQRERAGGSTIPRRVLKILAAAAGVGLLTGFFGVGGGFVNTGTVHAGAGASRLVSYDDREVPFDLAVVIPVHGGAAYVDRSPGLGDELGFIPVNQQSLQATVQPNVFAIGDATDVPTSKAGSVAHFEGEILVEGIRAYLAGRPVAGAFDGHTNCFIETGGGKALLIDFNYDTEPLTGHYPSRLGLPLLRESRLNHLGKLAFQRLYWHSLLPGRDLPGVSAAMPRRGKKGLPTSTETTPPAMAG